MYAKRALEVEFPEALNKLIKRKDNTRIERLNEIFNVTEQKWEMNLQRLITSEVKVKYVLIGEAAPYSEGPVQYFYNENLESNWRNIVYKAFLGKSIIPLLPELRLQALARKGFLLIDVLPFSEQYKSNQRTRKPYKDIIRLCAKW